MESFPWFNPNDTSSRTQTLAIIGTAFIVVAALLLQAVYRLTFHPLAKIPGPRLAAVTDYWRWYYEMKGVLPFKLKQLQAECNWPLIFRVGPNHVVVHDPTQYDVIYRVNSQFLKDRGFYEKWASGRNGGTTVTACDKQKHSARRKETMAQLSKQKVQALHPLVSEKLARVLGHVQQLSDSRRPVNVFYAWRCMTLDIISEFAFGRCLNALENPDFKCEMIDTMDHFVSHFNYVIRLPSFVLSLVMKPILRDIVPGAESMRVFFKWANTCVVDFRRNKDKHCLLDTLLDPDTPGEKLTVAQIQSEAEDTLVAGSDTTALTLTYACVNLARHPHLWERLYQEIMPVYGPPDGFPTLRPLENIPLLVACVKESLRLASPSPGYLWRTVPEQGYTLDVHGGSDKETYFVPPGTSIGMSAWVEHFDEDVFPDAEEFRPSRWLGPDNGTSGPDGDLDRYLVPFSKGSRQCGGLNLAYLEIYLALSAMIVRFRIKGEAEPGKPMVQREQFVGFLQDSEWNIFFEPRTVEEGA
ncbi:cytochrome P450 [Coniochaeta ligniaria NRRL 30616]|uniref:Cytochrome P450 n=1 Tax=Coniochaeta ligniaria NRRL 30616 TaxID=1408157 RepID=A0A1J7J8Z6_9PEZI|nr:cytochrome P450 [Coniochaeta ligniaria NRRL 30616]